MTSLSANIFCRALVFVFIFVSLPVSADQFRLTFPLTDRTSELVAKNAHAADYKDAFSAGCEHNVRKISNYFGLADAGAVDGGHLQTALLAAIGSPECVSVFDNYFGSPGVIVTIRRHDSRFLVPTSVSLSTASGIRPIFLMLDYSKFSFYARQPLDTTTRSPAPQEAIDLVLDGFDINYRNCAGYPAAYYAVQSGKFDLLKVMAAKGAAINVEFPFTDGREMVDAKYVDIVRGGTDASATFVGVLRTDRTCKLASGKTIFETEKSLERIQSSLDLAIAMYRGDTGAAYQTITVLVDAIDRVKADAFFSMFDGNAFKLPLRDHGFRLLDKFITKGADINARDAGGKTLLGRLIDRSMSKESIDALVARGAKI